MNKTSATEWLIKAWHNLSSANILLGVNHYSYIKNIEAK